MGAGIGSARHGEQQGEQTPGEDKRRVSQDGDAPVKKRSLRNPTSTRTRVQSISIQLTEDWKTNAIKMADRDVGAHRSLRLTIAGDEKFRSLSMEFLIPSRWDSR